MIALERARASVAVTVRAPLCAPAALLGLDADGAVWEPRDDGWAFAGAGVAAEVRGTGAARFAEVASAAEAVWRGVRDDAGDRPPLRMIGGLAFAPGAARGAAWAGFGDARFVLPRFTYWRRGDQAWLTAIDADPREALAALERAPRELGAVRAVREADPAVWRRHVEEIRAAIGDGACDKIVAARTCAVELAGAIDPAALLARLGERQPGCTRFAIQTGGRAFVGATPERLIARAGDVIATEALAGSIARRGDDDGERARLAASAKDRGEHAWVVDAVRAALAPLCATLDVPAEPSVRTLRQIHHLYTAVRGRLAAPRHVLEVAAALHPTPAVGGTPTAAALAWIAAREPEPRGWYASPVGWFDGDGDGEFAVAIRSGLVDGARALLYAGGGIVRDSDADAELDETRVKFRALASALGVA